MRSQRLLHLAVAATLATGPLYAWAAATWDMSKISPANCNQTAAGSTVYKSTSTGNVVATSTGAVTFNNVGNAYTCGAASSSDPALTATGWSTNGSTANNNSNSSGGVFTAAKLAQYTWDPDNNSTTNNNKYDYGIQNTRMVKNSTTGKWSANDVSTPQHSMDNKDNTDLISLNFGATKVALSSVTIGWKGTDSDISVLAYTGSNGAPPTDISGKKTIDLVGAGWTVVGHYKNLGSGTEQLINNLTTPISSSWWLISAYNQNYGVGQDRDAAKGAGGYDLCSTVVDRCKFSASSYDYVKLLAVAGTVEREITPSNSVPEPDALALFGLALAGMFAMGRRRKFA